MRLLIPCAVAMSLSAIVLAGEPPVEDGLILWLDAADPASIGAADGSGAASWSNLVNGQPLTQADPAKQPLYVADAGDGRPAIEFDGADDTLVDTAFTPSTVQEATVFLVTTPMSNAGSYRGWLSARATGTNDYLTGINIDMGANAGPDVSNLNVEGPKAATPGGIDLQTIPLAFGERHVIQVEYLDTGFQARFNGVPDGAFAPQNANAMTFDEVRVGCRFFLGAEQGHLDAQIHEVLVYSRPLVCEELQAVGAYLSAKWGVGTTYNDAQCDADINCDAKVDSTDLNLLLGAFGCTAGCDADVDTNGDGVINSLDLNIVLSAFGQGC